MLPTIQLIAFDVFGVIITDGHLVSHGLMPHLPATTSKAQVKPFYDAYTSGHISEAAFWQGIDLSIESQIRQHFLDVFELDEDLELVTQKLGHYYRLGILSNLGWEWYQLLEQRLQFSAPFEPRIISGTVGCQKPEPAIYQCLIAASKLAGEQIAFVDDRLENLAVAAELGMTTIHYAREKDDYPFEPIYTIKRLGELVQRFPF
ncbi:MAG: HAD-IA family hydrolase [Thiofilum sp.]|uniref:HAD family hydrolase n=1 Tax=Thiofilum sp. TaxID=2212733 RepID=UPI0025CC3232|nr:HAD-IA family hydrolase [Thiofilum sp.]MBK8452945.1 HAD-IA family hydrolase [Thiofilum sp.]